MKTYIIVPKDKLKNVSVSGYQDNVHLAYFELNFPMSWSHWNVHTKWGKTHSDLILRLKE